MGVGVYESDFGGKGKTFLVDTTIYDAEESYQDYLKDVGEEAVDYEQYLADESRQRYYDLEMFIREGTKLFFEKVQKHLDKQGARLPEQGTKEDKPAAFDRSFHCLYDYSNEIEIGVREWESDLVVGVSLVKDPRDEDPLNVVLEHGICVEDHMNRQRMMADAVAAHLRCMLAENGFECRYKTSGYTSAPYATENTQAEMQKAVEDFADLYLASARPAQEIMAENFERNPTTAISRILTEDLLFESEWNYQYYKDVVNYLVYDSGRKQVVLLDGDFDAVNETGIEIDDQSRLSMADPDLGYQVLRIENPENVRLIAKLQRNLPDRILVTPQAFEKAFGRDFLEEVAESRPSISP